MKRIGNKFNIKSPYATKGFQDKDTRHKSTLNKYNPNVNLPRLESSPAVNRGSQAAYEGRLGDFYYLLRKNCSYLTKNYRAEHC